MEESSSRRFSPEAQLAFDSYPWTDNKEKERVRVESAAVASGDMVELEDLPVRVRRNAERLRKEISERDTFARFKWKGESLSSLIDAFERTILSQVLAKTNGNAKAAAAALGTTPRIIRYKAHRLGIAEIKRNHIKSDIQ